MHSEHVTHPQGREQFAGRAFRALPVLLLALALGGTIGCTPGQRYDRMVKRELASGVRYDSLFLGLKLGMTTKGFYSQCWELNRLGVVRQGLQNTTVLYQLDDLNYPAEMDFYPTFTDNRIVEMPVKFRYKDWAPWQRHLFADSLQLDVLDLFETWYGNGFIEVRNRHGDVTFVKVDGNRQISIYKNADDHVWVLFKDLTAAGKEEEESAAENTEESR
jgi:hypothetical protein